MKGIMQSRASGARRRGFLTRWLAMILVALAVQTAVAQMPHHVVVLANRNSQDSMKAAHVFAALHGVPGENLIYLEVPEALTAGAAECTPEEFKRSVYDPAQKMVEDRGLSTQILAWVYSVDFPVRILTSENDRQQMSLMGLTFTRGSVPSLETLEKGMFRSDLFAGPSKEGGPKAPPRSFEVFDEGLGDIMPLPSMMLGYIGENGTDMETVLRCLSDGARAWQNGERPRVLLVKTDDEKRSGPREWQYAGVQAELIPRGGSVAICTNQPPAQTNLTGVMTGAKTVDAAAFGTFQPGAMAEHLTSFSAQFQKEQSKCTEWLKAGATVTAGMVTEPYNVWTKFPHARFFVHYASGCPAMESFYQALYSPVQVLLLGAPPAQIVRLPVEIKAVGLKPEIREAEDAVFVMEAKMPIPAQVFYSALLDGKEIKKSDETSLIELPFEEMSDGYHEVRLVAQARLPVTPGGFKDVPVLIRKLGRSMQITGLSDGDPHQVVVRAVAKGDEKPREIFLLWNGCELARQPYDGETDLSFDERTIGEGPHRLQAVGVYEDGMKVRSAPSSFVIAFNAPAE